VVFLALAALGCFVDLATKHYVFAWRGMPAAGRHADVWWLWEGYVGIETATNTGALFGLGTNQVTLFAVLSFVAAIGILYWLFAARAARDLLLTVALGLVMGGILGNLYDRLGLWSPPEGGAPVYAVRDWILLQFRGYTWPNFNIADSLLVCGAGILIWHALRSRHADPGSASTEGTKRAAAR
jgi:signal peptidase II